MKRPLIFQNAKMDSWHLIDWVETLSVCCVKHIGRRRRRTEASSMFTPMECEVLWASGGGVLCKQGIQDTVARATWFARWDLSSLIPWRVQSSEFRVQSMFMMKLYIWVSTTKWTGRQERRSWVAGSHVSQERALYCSRTNLSRGRQKQVLLFFQYSFC